MRNSTSITWFAQILLGLALFLGSAQVALIFWSTGWETPAACGVVAALGMYISFRAERREHPQRILRKARKSLNFPTQWAVKFDKAVRKGGVIPIAVIRSDGVRFVIDIQGATEARWADTPEPLLGHGKKLKSTAVAPLVQAATAWNATAVLWLPEATTSRNLRREGSNLIVVLGSARDLKHVLQGAEIAARYHSPDEGESMSAPLMASPQLSM